MQIAPNWLNHLKMKMMKSTWKKGKSAHDLGVASGGIRWARRTSGSLVRTLLRICVNLRHLTISCKLEARSAHSCPIISRSYIAGSLTFLWTIQFGCSIEFPTRILKPRETFLWDITAGHKRESLKKSKTTFNKHGSYHNCFPFMGKAQMPESMTKKSSRMKAKRC